MSSGAHVGEIPPPYVYGLPADKFASWRPNQARAAMRAIETPLRHPVLVAPTGFGKSAAAETIARYMGRSMYLTVTKALQDQINEDFLDRYDIRGKSNYDCSVLLDGGFEGWAAKCDQAEELCLSCHLRERGCEPYDRARRAKREQHVVSNYAKWLTMQSDDELGEFDVLICDEAHDAVEQLSSSMQVELRYHAVDKFCHQTMPAEQPLRDWSNWATRHAAKLRPLYDGMTARAAAGDRSRAGDLRELRGLMRALETLATARGGWAEDRPEGGKGVTFEPVWPRAYGHRLFKRVPKIVMMSATITRKDLDLLGVDPAHVDFAEYPSSFPIANRPVIAVPGARMSGSMNEQDKIEAVRRVDQIIDARLDRKGIIHTVSFERARDILRLSRHASLMVFNDPARRHGLTSSDHTKATVAEFRKRDAPVILIGPSFTTGWDFPGVQAEYQIIYKIPFMNRHASKVADARCKDDTEFDGWQAMKKIVQMAGRIVRSSDDRGETLITDAMWGDWFLKRNRKHAPNWFLQAVSESASIPVPLRKL